MLPVGEAGEALRGRAGAPSRTVETALEGVGRVVRVELEVLVGAVGELRVGTHQVGEHPVARDFPLVGVGGLAAVLVDREDGQRVRAVVDVGQPVRRLAGTTDVVVQHAGHLEWNGVAGLVGRELEDRIGVAAVGGGRAGEGDARLGVDDPLGLSRGRVDRAVATVGANPEVMQAVAQVSQVVRRRAGLPVAEVERALEVIEGRTGVLLGRRAELDGGAAVVVIDHRVRREVDVSRRRHLEIDRRDVDAAVAVVDLVGERVVAGVIRPTRVIDGLVAEGAAKRGKGSVVRRVDDRVLQVRLVIDPHQREDVGIGALQSERQGVRRGQRPVLAGRGGQAVDQELGRVDDPSRGVVRTVGGAVVRDPGAHGVPARGEPGGVDAAGRAATGQPGIGVAADALLEAVDAIGRVEVEIPLDVLDPAARSLVIGIEDVGGGDVGSAVHDRSGRVEVCSRAGRGERVDADHAERVPAGVAGGAAGGAEKVSARAGLGLDDPGSPFGEADREDHGVVVACRVADAILAGAGDLVTHDRLAGEDVAEARGDRAEIRLVDDRVGIVAGDLEGDRLARADLGRRLLRIPEDRVVGGVCAVARRLPGCVDGRGGGLLAVVEAGPDPQRERVRPRLGTDQVARETVAAGRRTELVDHLGVLVATLEALLFGDRTHVSDSDRGGVVSAVLVAVDAQAGDLSSHVVTHDDGDETVVLGLLRESVRSEPPRAIDDHGRGRVRGRLGKPDVSENKAKSSPDQSKVGRTTRDGFHRFDLL